MSKGILKFDLNDYDDARAHLRATKSIDLALALFNIDQELRKRTKYFDSETRSIEILEELEDLYKQFYTILTDQNIDLNELLN